MKVSFNIDGKEYHLKPITLQDHYTMQIEIALNPAPGFFIVSYLSGCPEEELRELTVEQWDKIWVATQAYLKDQNDKTKKHSPTIKIDKVEYGMCNLEKMSIGEFADLDVIMNAKDFENRVHEAMAILYRPVVHHYPDGSFEVEAYNIETVSKRAEIFKRFPVAEVRRAIGFFLGFVLQSSRASLISLDLEMLESQMPGAKETILNLIKVLDGFGTELSLPSLEEIFSISSVQARGQLERLSTTSPINGPIKKGKRWSLKKLIKNISYN